MNFDDYVELTDDMAVDNDDPLSLLIAAEDDEDQQPITTNEEPPMKTTNASMNMSNLFNLITAAPTDTDQTPSIKPVWFELKEGRTFDRLSDFQLIAGCAKALRKCVRHADIAQRRHDNLVARLEELELAQEADTFSSGDFIKSLTAQGVELKLPSNRKVPVSVNPDGWMIEDIKSSLEEQILELEDVLANCQRVAGEIQEWVNGREMTVEAGTKTEPDPVTGLPIHKRVERKAGWDDVILAAREQQAYIDGLGK